jgi:peptidylprolyl isomerase
MKSRVALILAPLAMLAANAALAADGEIIARIGKTEVSTDDIRAYIQNLSPREQAALAKDPLLLNQTVRQLLAERIVLKEAQAKKWEQEPAVAAQLQRLRDAAIVESYLQDQSKPPDGFPSETELQSAYEASKSQFLVPRQFQIAQIFIALPKNADKSAEEKARKRLDEVQKKLKQKGADFAAIARTDSDDAEGARRGGDIGWLAESQITPEIRQLVIGLAKDAVADPVRLDTGWHIVKLLDTKPAATRPLAEVRDELVQRLRDERALAYRRAYLTKLLQENPPAINELALSKLLSKAEK